MKHPEYYQRWLKLHLRRVVSKCPTHLPYLFFAMALIVFSWDNFSSHTVILSKWIKPSPPSIFSDHRIPANDQCSEFSLHEVQAENTLLEKSQFTHHLVGKWEHLNYKDLPYLDVNFLTYFKPELDESQKNQILGCRRVECILENIYSTKEQAVLVWNWYLKTGLVLDYKSFTLEETKKIWLLTSKLPDHYFHQDEVKVISKTQARDANCFAYSNETIYLNELCEDVPLNLTTALTQQYLPKWLKAHPEWKNALTKPKSPPLWMDKSWSHHQNEFNFLTKEIALYLNYGEARQITQSFIVEQLFKQSWDKESTVKKEFQKDLWVWREMRSVAIKDCMDLHRSVFSQKKSYRSIASLSEPHPLAQCVRESATQKFLKEKRAWLLQSSTACKWRIPEADETLKNYYQKLQSIVTKDIDQLEWKIYTNGLNWLKDFQAREKAMLEIDPTDSFFKCQGVSSEKDCYDQNFSSKLRERLPASSSEEVLEDYSYTFLKEKLASDIALKRSWIKSHFKHQSQAAWKKCWAKGTQEMAKIYSPLEWVSTGLEYIDARFGSCLDVQSDNIIESFFSESSAESVYWKKDLKDSIRYIWKNRISEEANREKLWLNSYREEIKSRLSVDLKNLMTKSPIFEPKAACLRRLSFHYPTPLYFHSRFQLNQKMGHQLCQEVFKSEDMKKSISHHRENRWNVLGKALKTTLVTEWEVRVRKYCLGRVPATQVQSLLESESMKGCIRDQFELAWPISTNEVGLNFSLPGESLDEFKADIKAISQAVIQEKLRQ